MGVKIDMQHITRMSFLTRTDAKQHVSEFVLKKIKYVTRVLL